MERAYIKQGHSFNQKPCAEKSVLAQLLTLRAAGTPEPRKTTGKGEKAQRGKQNPNPIESTQFFRKEAPNSKGGKKKKNIQITHGELEMFGEESCQEKNSKDIYLPDICRPKRDTSPLDYLRIWNSPCSWDISKRTLRLETRPPSSRRSTSIIDHPYCWRHPTQSF